MTDANRPAARPRALLACGLLAAIVATLAAPGKARADRIVLRGGGQVKGKLVADRDHPGQFLLIGEVGKTPISFRKDQISQVTPEKSDLDEYIVLRERERKTGEAEYELGLWCEEHKLRDLSLTHFEAAVKLDPSIGEAHRKLGHVLMGSRWLDEDGVKEAQGMVRYRGRWVTPEEKERREADAAMAAEGANIARRIRLLRASYVAGPDSRTQDAERQLLEFREPKAVVPVLRILGEDPIPILRSLAARILGAIPGPEADRGLVGRLLDEADDSVRQATLAEIAHREASVMVPLLARALRSARPEVVNRGAAWALGQMNAVAVVPKLIPALITIEYQVVMVDSGPGSGSMGVSFNSVGTGSGSTFGGSGPSIPILTPPAVGPGVAAYGATSVPFYGGSGIGIGGGGSSRGPVPKMVSIEHRNVEVLAALVKMTGNDFGFDIPTWSRWVSTAYRAEERPSRRVPQP